MFFKKEKKCKPELIVVLATEMVDDTPFLGNTGIASQAC